VTKKKREEEITISTRKGCCFCWIKDRAKN
jgi:hypothetical protein